MRRPPGSTWHWRWSPGRFRHFWGLERNLRPHRCLILRVTEPQGGTRMTKFRIIGAAALSLVLAGPAMAAASSGSGMHRVHHKHYGRVIHTMPAQRMSAQDFDHFDLGIARPTYPSGWGG